MGGPIKRMKRNIRLQTNRDRRATQSLETKMLTPAHTTSIERLAGKKVENLRELTELAQKSKSGRVGRAFTLQGAEKGARHVLRHEKMMGNRSEDLSERDSRVRSRFILTGIRKWKGLKGPFSKNAERKRQHAIADALKRVRVTSGMKRAKIHALIEELSVLYENLSEFPRGNLQEEDTVVVTYYRQQLKLKASKLIGEAGIENMKKIVAEMEKTYGKFDWN